LPSFDPDVLRSLATGGMLLILATAVIAEVLEATEDPTKESRQWLEAVPEGGSVRIDNPYGNVYSRFGGYGNELEVLATIQRLESELPALGVTFDRGESVLAVRIGPSAPDVDAAIETRDRIDLVVFVPQGVGLEVRTRDGSVEAKGLKGDVTVSSITGDVQIRGIAGRVQAKSARGRIAATLETGATDQPQSLATETGEIEVHLWEDAHHAVRIETSGEISTDFSLTVEHLPGQEPGKYALATVGEGGASLLLTSKQGNVRLLRLQRSFKPEP